jgi:hypothetical protein
LAVLERLFWYGLLVLLLLSLFFFSRERFRKVVLVGALSVVGGFVIRLLRPHDGDYSLLLIEVYFLLAIGALYGAVWLSTRYFGARSRSGSHRRD